ncbi:MAG TPA: HlyD family type I secretion periplasmic adaptor subunit [Arenimonas sp.]|nr:HlyD family type I secretion periplasmic adaptor subunit [Arenimonas sp.]
MRDHLAALRDLLARYTAVFKAAWSVRDRLDPPKRSGDELAFLPAHLELTDTPVSPAPRWIMRGIVAFFVVALLWAIVGQLDIVATAPGKTVVGSRTKILQPLEAAVVTAIHVRDGQRVEAGELLIELDATGTGADLQRSEEAVASARAAEARYAGLLQALDSGQPPADFTLDGVSPERASAENRLTASEYAAYLARRDALGSALAQREAELATVRGLIERLDESTAIAIARADDMRRLGEKKYVARHEVLLAEQQRIEAERDLATQRSRTLELQAAIQAQREERDAQDAEFRRQAEDGLRQAREQLAQYAPEAAKAEHRNAQMQLRAPVAGTVQQLVVHTVGGVVTPAQPLLAIVPEGESLEVEALVLNKDIGFVRAGQEAVIKVESFPYTRYGYLTGEVLSVSHDAAQDEQLGLVYQARVKLDRSELVVDGATVRLSAGMNLSVEIKTGKRRVISYLLSPLQTKAQGAGRER